MESYNTLARYYDLFTSDVPYQAWADYYCALFEKEGITPEIVLDLACGTGTLALLMAQKGYEMIGTDSSVEMLMQATPKASDFEGTAPIFLNQAMEDLDLYGTVDACYCALDSINYIVNEDNLSKALQRVHLFLAPDGLFVFDLNTEYKLKGIAGQCFVRDADEAFCTWETEYDEKKRLCTYQFTFFEERERLWQRNEETHVERAYTIEEMKQFLATAGFRDVKIYGELSFLPPKETEDRIFFTARK